jgi:ATP-binding cassette subfamily C protein LapB
LLDKMDIPQSENLAFCMHACAERRGHVVTLLEVQQSVRRVLADTPEEVLQASWRWLFPGERLVSVPAALARSEHVPALVWASGSYALVSSFSESGEASLVRSVDAKVRVEHLRNTIWIPIRSIATAPSAEDDRPASTAIRTVLSENKGLFARAGLATLFINVLAIVTSLFAMQVYDRVVPNFAYATLWVLVSGVVLCLVFDFVFKWLRLRLVEYLARRADDVLSLYFFEKLMALKLDRRPNKTGSLVAQVRDYESVKVFMTSTALFALADLPFVLFFISVIAMIGGHVSLFPLLFIPIAVLIGLLVQRPLARLQQQQSDDSTRRHGMLVEVIHGGESVKALSAEWRFSLGWQELTREISKCGEQIRKLGGLAQYITGGVQQLCYVLLIAAGVYRIEDGALTMGGLIACSILAGRAMANTAQISSIIVQWQHAKHALHILNHLISLPSDNRIQQQASISTNALSLTLSNVRYAYAEAASLQLEIDQLTVASGERVAVLGRNGSGKSTLLKIMAGLCTPNEGRACLGDIDMQVARQSWLRSSVGYLPQEVRLFAGTLRENLSMGLPSPLDDELSDVLALTGLDSLVAQQPSGLDSMVFEGGAGFSGGQRQMIGIARLMLQKPAIWLLDEPSASLDQESEQCLIKIIKELPTSISVVFATHKPQWLSLSHRTLLLESGRLRADVPSDRVRTGSSAKMPPSIVKAGAS